MARKRIYGAVGAGLLVIGAPTYVIHDRLSDPETQPTDVVRTYEGLPVPGGEAISHATGAVLVANLFGDGHVEIQGQVKDKTMIKGTVQCEDDALSLQADTVNPTRIFSGVQTREDNNVGGRMCEGDRVAINAFDENALPRYIGTHIVDMDLVSSLITPKWESGDA